MSKSPFDVAYQTLIKRSNGEIKGFPLPWPQLQKLFRPRLWAGVYQFVGLPGAFKTTIALHALIEGVRDDSDVPGCGAYISLEMSSVDILARVASYFSGIPWADIAEAELSEAKLNEVLLPVMDKLAHNRIIWEFHAPTSATVDLIENAAKTLKERFPGSTPLIVVDYLQLLRGGLRGGQPMRQVISGIAAEAKQIANDSGVAILFLSSTPRSFYDRVQNSDEHPWDDGAHKLIGMGKESGETEYGADAVFVMAPEDDTTNVHIGLAKGRSKRKGSWATLHLDLDNWRIVGGKQIKGAKPLQIPGASEMNAEDLIVTYCAQKARTIKTLAEFTGLDSTEVRRLVGELVEQRRLEKTGNMRSYKAVANAGVDSSA